MNIEDIKPNVRIVLAADAEENLPEERGTVEGWDVETETIVVRIDPKYRVDEKDDGLREASFEDVELEAPYTLN